MRRNERVQIGGEINGRVGVGVGVDIGLGQVG